MRILITGGCGFIGAHLADALVADGHAVTILDNLSTGRREYAPQSARLVVGDVTNAPLVSELVADVEAVFHLAAVASVERCTSDWLGSHRTNVTGSITVFDAARVARVPVIYASSAAVYGDNPNLPLVEDAVTQPLSNYGMDKLIVEHYAAMAWKNYQLPSVRLRFFNVYGPRQDPSSPYSGVISKFVACTLRGEAMTFFGDGEQTRDFIYVADVVKLLRSALMHVGRGATVYNGCTGIAVSLKHLAATIAQASGQPLTTRYEAPRVGDIRHSLGSPERAVQQLSVCANTPLDVGIKHLF